MTKSKIAQEILDSTPQEVKDRVKEYGEKVVSESKWIPVIGEIVILDTGFNNSSFVKVLDVGNHFCQITDGFDIWSVMRYRLTQQKQ